MPDLAQEDKASSNLRLKSVASKYTSRSFHLRLDYQLFWRKTIMERPLNVSIYGSCVLRDMFNARRTLLQLDAYFARTSWISATPFTSAAASRQLCPRCGSRIRMRPMLVALRIASSRFMGSMGQVVHRVSMYRPSPGRHTISTTDKANVRRRRKRRPVPYRITNTMVGGLRAPGTTVRGMLRQLGAIAAKNT